MPYMKCVGTLLLYSLWHISHLVLVCSLSFLPRLCSCCVTYSLLLLGYTWEMVTEMHTIVKNLKHRVTFPVRASLVAASRAQLLWLLNLNRDYSLTVWHSSDDLYDVKSMSFLRDKKYIGRVYYDLPDRQIMELKSLPVT